MNSSIFKETLSLYSSKKKDGKTERIIAECPSSYSDRFNWYLPNWVFTKSRSCISIILLTSLQGFNVINEQSFRQKCLHESERQNEIGDWKIVKLLALQEPFTPFKIIELILENFSQEDYFGNILNRAIKLKRLLKIRDIDSEITGPVKYPVRHRGYKDKGTYRDPSSVPIYIQRKERPEFTKIEELVRLTPNNFYSNIKGRSDSSGTVRELELLNQERNEKREQEDKLKRKEIRSTFRRFWKYQLSLITQKEQDLFEKKYLPKIATSDIRVLLRESKNIIIDLQSWKDSQRVLLTESQLQRWMTLAKNVENLT